MPPKKAALRFSTQNRIALPGSEKFPFAQTNIEREVQPSPQKPLSSSAKITVSVMVRPKGPLTAANRSGKVRLTRAQFRKSHCADPAAIKLVQAFAKEFGLTVSSSVRPEQRLLQLSGTAAAMQQAFGVTLVQQTVGAATYRTREGAILIPEELSGVIEAVLGLDNRPQAVPHFRVFSEGHAAAASVSYTPVQIAQLYQFPQGVSAAGQTIGIIELGGGFRAADIKAYFKTLNQTAPTVVAVSVDGGKNSPTTADGADGEVMLDIEVAAAVAPGAKIAVYFAPNTDQGFIDAISTAIHDTTNKPSVISISWGGPESSWTQQAMTALDTACQAAAALGVTITAASGDNGSTDGATGNNVDFPASSPHILACGGTTLVGTGSTITSEVVWNELANNEGATGGGVSNVFPKPTWQSTANVPKPTESTEGRGVPDVAGDADPATGYTVRVDGQTMVIGGTSAVAPLWAGLLAVNNAQNKKSAGFINTQIYAAKAKAAFRDITSGDNGAFSAGSGWDPCTGMGSPIGTKLIQLLGGTTPTKKKSPPKPKGKGKKAAAR